MMSHNDGPPEPIRSVVAGLWNAQFSNETSAFESGRFRLLEQFCSSTYPEITGSRLSKRPVENLARQRLHSALKNFFRWTSAPWYEGPCPDAGETARRLHAAFLMSKVLRTHFVPLDRLDLTDPTTKPRETVRQVRFGPCEIVLLNKEELAERIPVRAVSRFDRWRWFPIQRLADFYWLIVPEIEEAGPIWRRSWSSWLDTPINEIGRVHLYESTHPDPIENALFTLLLCLVKDPSDAPWEPFGIPWVYSVTDDPFAEPPRAPDPSALTWTLIGDEHDEIEVPYRSDGFHVTQREVEAALAQRWERLQAALERANSEKANFHPLTKHFFVKALAQGGIDEIVANLSCIEATLMLRERNGRKKMMDRYKRLVGDGDAYDWLQRAYHLRDKYLHSLGSPTEATSWKQLAQTRWSVVKAVDAYLSQAETRGLNREQLLRSLD